MSPCAIHGARQFQCIKKKRRVTGLYALRRLTAARATKKRSRACALCAVFLRHIFLCAKIASQFFYRAQKNVSYSLNVMQHLTWHISVIILTIDYKKDILKK
jgi:hypothetical protein